MRKKRWVIKIGSSIILKNKFVDLKPLKNIVQQIISLKKKGIKIIVVSSGAIVLGKEKIGFGKKWPTNLAGKQSLAALGQPELMAIYQKFFKKYNQAVAQILLSRDDIFSKRYLDIERTLFTLLRKGIIPIINENDTTATEEIKFGDNDLLSAYLSAKIKADLLILLSDIDGFYDQEGQVIERIRKITSKIKKMIFAKKKQLTQGGMASKIKAGQIASRANIPCLVINGKRKDALLEVMAGRPIGTEIYIKNYRGIS